jgi:hypothetical protein
MFRRRSRMVNPLIAVGDGKPSPDMSVLHQRISITRSVLHRFLYTNHVTARRFGNLAHIQGEMCHELLSPSGSDPGPETGPEMAIRPAAGWRASEANQ